MIEHYKADNLASSRVLHGFFTRNGGVSTGIYDSLNCGPGSGDDPALVSENRRLVAAHLSARRDTHVITLYQVHGNSVEIINSADSDYSVERPRADAVVTRARDIILGVLTADCAPVLFADAGRGIIGAAHAGWRGALAGILENTVDAFISLGSEPGDIAAAIGPCIGQDSYEVDAAFQTSLLAGDPDGRYYLSPGDDEQHFQFNLEGYAAHRLARKGIKNVCRTGMDTYSQPDRFFSFRRATHRQEADYGRQVSAIMLK